MHGNARGFSWRSAARPTIHTLVRQDPSQRPAHDDTTNRQRTLSTFRSVCGLPLNKAVDWATFGLLQRRTEIRRYGFDGQKVCKVLKFTHVYVPSLATMLFLWRSEYEWTEMSKKGQTSVSNAEGSGRRCTSTLRSESHGSRGWKSQCVRTGQKLNLRLCSGIRQPWIPQGLCEVGA